MATNLRQLMESPYIEKAAREKAAADLKANPEGKAAPADDKKSKDLEESATGQPKRSILG